MKSYDSTEDRLTSEEHSEANNSTIDLERQIYNLMTQQGYAVLCTQGSGQPYGSVIAFAINDNLNALVFATSVTTHKYRLLSRCDRVALVVDNRADSPRYVSHTQAVTVIGKAQILQQNNASESWRERLICRHPQLSSFITAPDSALVRVDIQRYLHVDGISHVRDWIPP